MIYFKNPNIALIFKKLKDLPSVYEPCAYECKEGIRISLPNFNKVQKEYIYQIALGLKPWRKGPFYLGDLLIDSEWRSYIKYQQIIPFIDLKDKDVADIGCNNGYYLFEMMKESPKSLVGFDPSEIFYTQFHFINHFLKSSIVYELLGVNDIISYRKKFDIILCLGVLYHRMDPIACLKSLSQGLRDDGELILDTLIIDGNEEFALCPKKSYAKMKNVYFIPSIPALIAWCYKAKLELVKILSIKETTLQEQRKTDWIDTLSLDSFMDLENHQTIEGYPPPKRGYFKFKRIKNG